MLIASIDISEGKAVQLRQGKEKVLTSDRDPVDLAREFNRFGEVAVIDLDAAMGRGDNLDLVRRLCRVAEVRAGGGIRTVERGRELLRAGAHRIIVGTAATPEFLANFPAHRVQVALDHRDGTVVDHGWTRSTGEALRTRAQAVQDHCSGYLVTNVGDEGGLGGMDLDAIRSLDLPHPLTAAGGVAGGDEVVELSREGIDVQVGMALYTGRLDPVEVFVASLDFAKVKLIPTVVQDTAGQVIMLAYSSPESLTRALKTGRGVYYSRSRQEIWEKGATSGHTQRLVSCRTDCDRDSLLFTVEQTGHACHRESYSCFGSQFAAPRFSPGRLYDILKDRQQNSPEGSYTARLLGDRKLLQRKIMEEAFEAVTFADRRELVWEVADCLYFLSTLAVAEGVEWEEIVSELGGREK